MNKIANRKVICDVLMEHAEQDQNITVLCSDSRGSASLSAFADKFPDQFVEVGIAEQDLVGIAAGMAHSGKKPYVASPASFLSTRSYEQIKVDVAYSNTNVKLIGISGGVSYGALGMSHHSLQDIAAISAIPNMRIYLPSDRHQTRALTEALLKDEQNAYIRIGRNPVEDIYSKDNLPFKLNRATKIGNGKDVLIVACGEMVKPAVDAMELLKESNVHATVLDMYCLKPLDQTTLLKEAANVKLVITVEEHAPSGGLGSMVCQVLSANAPKKTIVLSLPDEPVVTGSSSEVFAHYALNPAGIAATVKDNLV